MSTLICLPPAGSGTADYRGWTEFFPASVTVAPVLLPARETQLSLPAPTTMPALIEHLLATLDPPADYALYGHSFGAWVAYELAHAWSARGRAPRHLFVGARRAPHLPSESSPIAHLDDAGFVAAVQERYAAIPAQLLARPGVLALFLPALRADFAVMESYAPADRAPLALPITAIRGIADTTVQRAQIAAWSTHTSATFGLRQVPGGHFFHREDPELLTDILSASLRQARNLG